MPACSVRKVRKSAGSEEGSYVPAALGFQEGPAGPAVPGKKDSDRGSEPWYPGATGSGTLGSPDASDSFYAQVLLRVGEGLWVWAQGAQGLATL